MSYMPDTQGARAAQAGILVHKTASSVVDKTLFTVTGGRIFVTGIFGKVTTAIGAGSQGIALVFDPLASGPNMVISAATTVDADPVGTMYALPDVPAAETALQIVEPQNWSNGVLFHTDPWLVPEGDVLLDGTGAEAGAIEWFLMYYPLDAGASVVAA